MRPRNELACLYFPYADPQPSPGLLMAALLFDRIYYLEANFFKRPTLGDKRNDISDALTPLQRSGVIQEIGPDLMGIEQHFFAKRAIVDSNVSKEIQASIFKDLQNVEIKKLVESQGKVYWYIPNGQYLFWNGLGIIFEYSSDKNGKLVPEIFTTRVDFYNDLIKKQGYIASVKPFEDSRLRNSPTDLMVRLPYLAAEAMMVAIALHACREFNLTPFTDDILHHQYLVAKLKDLGINNSSQEQTGSLSLVKGNDYINTGVRSIGIVLPQISNLTPEKVVSLREECSDELSRFRAEMRKLAYEIETKPWDDEYEDRVNSIIESQVIPAVTDFRDKLYDLKQELGLTLIEKAITTSPLPFFLNIAIGLPIEWVLPASVGAIWLKEVLDYYRKKSYIKKNGVSFLINLQ
jgi:hypothetical protein